VLQAQVWRAGSRSAAVQAAVAEMEGSALVQQVRACCDGGPLIAGSSDRGELTPQRRRGSVDPPWKPGRNDGMDDDPSKGEWLRKGSQRKCERGAGQPDAECFSVRSSGLAAM
jgi:hypothetical protein